jgi:putative ubiquitin-RnfH superfamily antitoxin RatB of RatAB toxin-antitoxin module
MLVELSVVEQRYQAVLAVLNGSVAYQQISVGKHRAGVIVDVHLDGSLLQVWHRDELLKTIVRTDIKEVRKKRAAQAR